MKVKGDKAAGKGRPNVPSFLRVLNPMIPWETRERDGEMVWREVKRKVRSLGRQR